MRYSPLISAGRSALVFAGLASLCGVAAAQSANDISLRANLPSNVQRTDLPSNVQHTRDPIPLDFIVKAGNYTSTLNVNYVVYDLYKNPVGGGSFNVPVVSGTEAKQTFTFTPPENGWYTVETQVSKNGSRIAGKGLNLGVTPSFAGLPDIAVGPPVNNNHVNDPQRMAFSGLRLDRVNTSWSSDPVGHINNVLNQAVANNVNVIVQFENKAQATDLAHIAQRVNQFKGRVKYWEVWNEPNLFGASPESYVTVLKDAYNTIKSIDPNAKVLGPTLVDINLDWYRRFYQAGGGQYMDILSVHDYEGNEAIDPGHWRRKYGELRQIMSTYGDPNKEIWQTERAIGGVRGKLAIGGVQAVRTMLHRDLLDSMGIPNEHNSFYYLNQHGYSDVPTYAWSNAGPNPVALALRTRDAMIQDRKFANTLDFGPTGDKIYFGLRYTGAVGDGSTLILRNYGTLDRPVTLNVTGGSTVTVVDSFGNQKLLNVVNGKVNVMTSGLPVYLRLAQGQQVSAPQIDFGENIASRATFSFSGQTSSNKALLTNGIFEAAHPSNPNKTYWEGRMAGTSQSLTMTFAEKQHIGKAIIYGVRADNYYCALLDYDLQYWNGGTWVTLDQVRAPVGATDIVDTHYDASGNTWYMDQNFYVHEFDPIYTDQLRLVALRVTNGFQPDNIASSVTGWYAHSDPQLMLREIEIYSPVPEPSALSLLVAGPAVLLRRHRRAARRPV